MHISSKLRTSFAFLCFVLISPVMFDVSFAQNVVVPSGTASRAQLIKSTTARNGQELSAKLMDPIYQGDRLILPAGTLLQGKIVDLKTDKKRRIRARLNGDFTPFHTARVQFGELMLPGGPVSFSTNGATTGATVLHLRVGGLYRRDAVLRQSLRPYGDG